MSRSISSSGRPARLACWCIAAVTAACLGLSGCTTLGYSDYDFSQVEGFGDDMPAHWSRDFRPPENQVAPHAVTNKGMQIERSLGVR